MESNKEIALRVLTGAFIDRDISVVERYFAPEYVQHNPSLPNGRAAIPNLIAGLGQNFSYEPGMVVPNATWSWFTGATLDGAQSRWSPSIYFVSRTAA